MRPVLKSDGTLLFVNAIDHVLNDLRPSLQMAIDFLKAEKYTGVANASTDMFVAVLSTAHDFIVG